MTTELRQPDRGVIPDAEGESTGLVPSSAPFTPTPFSGLTWKWLITAVLMFALGGVFILIIQNIRVGEQVAFSTPDLLGFVFGIALSAASIVLALAAISLGKSSEQAMIQRSDQSIRLQNEVFVRTTDALARIESSTGVTEKRIEDIISGRAGDISQAVAQKLAEGPRGQTVDAKQIEREIRDSLMQQLSVPRREDAAAARMEAVKQMAEAQTAYRRFQGNLLVAIANSRVVKCERLGDGTFDKGGSDLVDVIVDVQGKRVALSSFSVRPPLFANHMTHFPKFLRSALNYVDKEGFHALILAFDGMLPVEGGYNAILAEFRAMLKADLANRLISIDGADGSAVQRVITYLERIDSERSLPRPA